MFLDKFLLFCIFGSFVIINDRERLVAAQDIINNNNNVNVNSDDIVYLDASIDYDIEILPGEIIGMLIYK